jgi:phosphatidylinositol alpha-1,6-mannosyltransferase
MHLLALVSDAFGANGGIAQYNRDLFTALGSADSGNRIFVLPRHGSCAGTDLPPGVRQLEPAQKWRFALAAFRTASREGPFDAVFCGHLRLVLLAAMIARMMGLPLWVQLHGTEAWGSFSRRQILASEHAALVTSVSRHTRRRFLGMSRIDPGRVRVLPNTVDGRFAPGPTPDYLLDRHGLRGKRVLLTVGRLAATERGKGHDRVLRAVRTLVESHPDLVYLVVGDGDDRPRLEAVARQIGLDRVVMFAGIVPPAELVDYYRVADVFVMPSIQEGFGIVFLEAAASGVSVIGGDRDGSVDALADGALGRIIDPTDEAQLVAAIEAALAGTAPDPAQVARYRFENFASLVRELTAAYLLPRRRAAAEVARDWL